MHCSFWRKRASIHFYACSIFACVQINCAVLYSHVHDLTEMQAVHFWENVRLFSLCLFFLSLYVAKLTVPSHTVESMT